MRTDGKREGKNRQRISRVCSMHLDRVPRCTDMVALSVGPDHPAASS